MTIQRSLTGLLPGAVLLAATACGSSNSDSTNSGSTNAVDDTQADTAGTADTANTGNEEVDGPLQADEENQLVSDTDAQPILVPLVAADSELESLIDGLTRQAAITLLDLNTRIAQGEELTQQQEQCLGAYEEGLGQPLLAINCETALTTDDIALYVNETAFNNTDICSDAIVNGNADGCVLKTMSLRVDTTWTTPSTGLPQPLFPGAEIAFAIDQTFLTIGNLPEAITGVFFCQIDLENGGSTEEIGVTNCVELVKSVADEIEIRQTL